MEPIYEAVIQTAPVTKKNSQQIASIRTKTGKARHIIIPSAKYRQYEKDAGEFLSEKGIDCRVNVKALYYMPTRRRVDLVNLHEALCDVLVHYKVLKDDNDHIIAAMDGSRVFYDKENPRTELTITLLEEE
jgi:Holliday junction resolvase RusA-like endonuclease